MSVLSHFGERFGCQFFREKYNTLVLCFSRKKKSVSLELSKKRLLCYIYFFCIRLSAPDFTVSRRVGIHAREWIITTYHSILERLTLEHFRVLLYVNWFIEFWHIIPREGTDFYPRNLKTSFSLLEKRIKVW